MLEITGNCYLLLFYRSLNLTLQTMETVCIKTLYAKQLNSLEKCTKEYQNMFFSLLRHDECLYIAGINYDFDKHGVIFDVGVFV